MNAYGVYAIYGLLTLAITKKRELNERQHFGGTIKALPRMKLWTAAMVCGGIIAVIFDNLSIILPRFERFVEHQDFIVKVMVAMAMTVAATVTLVLAIILPVEATKKRH